jgi:hypothetical protein
LKAEGGAASHKAHDKKCKKNTSTKGMSVPAAKDWKEAERIRKLMAAPLEKKDRLSSSNIAGAETAQAFFRLPVVIPSPPLAATTQTQQNKHTTRSTTKEKEASKKTATKSTIKHKKGARKKKHSPVLCVLRKCVLAFVSACQT